LKAAREIVVAVVLVAVGVASAWLAHLHVISQSYHPVVRLASPDGLTYTAVQDAKQERQACGAANDRFLRPVKKSCKDCEVVLARCERQLDGFERTLYEGKDRQHHFVQGPGIRMAIEGPDATAKASCEQIAKQMVESGLKLAACVHPTKAS
jgi:hypothetical protein